ncbi:cation:dicarboxylase symporter family transporter, partial [Streptococcus suis]
FPELFSRSNLMALIVFTVIFAFALIQVGEKAHGIVKGLENMTEVIVKIIGIVMKIAPLGLGCYFAILLGTNGSDVIAPLSKAIL